MPTYIPYTWTNETPSTSPVKYAITDDTAGAIAASATIAPVTSITPGSPLNSTNLNHMEQGIKDAQDTANLPIVVSKLVDGILSANAEGRGKMADGFITLAKLAADLRFQKLYEFVGNGSSIMDWTSIPGTFKHLVMFYNGLSSRTSAGWDDLYLRINGDSAANYYTTLLTMEPSFGTRWNFGVTSPNAKGLHAGILPSQSEGNLNGGSGLVLFSDYAGTTFYKSCIEASMFFGSQVTGFAFASSYRNNAAPITHLTGYMYDGVALRYPRAGSVFSLYGFN